MCPIRFLSTLSPYSRKPSLFGPNMSICAKGVSRGVHNIAFLLSPDCFCTFDLCFVFENFFFLFKKIFVCFFSYKGHQNFCTEQYKVVERPQKQGWSIQTCSVILPGKKPFFALLNKLLSSAKLVRKLVTSTWKWQYIKQGLSHQHRKVVEYTFDIEFFSQQAVFYPMVLDIHSQIALSCRKSTLYVWQPSLWW